MILSFKETKELLLKYNLPFLETQIVLSEEGLLGAVEKTGFPLVLKIASKDILHRTELGLIEKDIKNMTQAREVFLDLTKKAQSQKISHEGVLVQKQIKGVELFCGLKRDKTFGPVLMFGLGGIFVEALQDIVFGLCPLSSKEALDLIENIKGKKILAGFRGMLAVDKNVLADMLANLSFLISANHNIQEADFNPIIACGKDIFIVDAKLIY